MDRVMKDEARQQDDKTARAQLVIGACSGHYLLQMRQQFLGQDYSRSQFTDGETEAQVSEVPCLHCTAEKWQDWDDPDFTPKPPSPRWA